MFFEFTLVTTVNRDASAQIVEGTQKVNDSTTSKFMSLALSMHYVIVQCKRRNSVLYESSVRKINIHMALSPNRCTFLYAVQTC